MSNYSRTVVTDIQPKPYTQNGVKCAPANTDGTYNAEILPDFEIRIYGTYTNNGHYDAAAKLWVVEPKPFDKAFRLGNEAEYDSYNLSYTGKIVGIGPKTVTIENHGKKRRLDLYEFCRRNWNFDAEKIARRNAETMMYI